MLFKVAGTTWWASVLGGIPGLACLGLLAGLCLFTAALGGGWVMLAGWQPSAPASVTQLQVRITLQPQVATAGGVQTVSVAVQDATLRPVTGVSITLTVHAPGQERRFSFPLTNTQGQTSQVYTVSLAPPGTIIPIEFQISYPGCPNVQVVASYLVWDQPELQPNAGSPVANIRVDCPGQAPTPFVSLPARRLDVPPKEGPG
jgi:hypothetical protein